MNNSPNIKITHILLSSIVIPFLSYLIYLSIITPLDSTSDLSIINIFLNKGKRLKNVANFLYNEFFILFFSSSASGSFSSSSSSSSN